MKKLFLTIITALGISSSIQAADYLETTIRSVYRTKYLAFGSGFELYGRPVVQTDVFTAVTNGPLTGFSFDLWSSTGIDTKWGNNYGDEIDLGLGYSRSFGKYTASVGLTYFDEPKSLRLGAFDVLYANLKVSRPIGPLTAQVQFESYTTMKGTPFDGGNLYSVGLSYGRPLGKGFGVFTSSSLVYDDGGFGLDRGFFARGSVGLNWQASKHITLHLAQYDYFRPFGVKDVRRKDGVLSVGASLKF